MGRGQSVDNIRNIAAPPTDGDHIMLPLSAFRNLPDSGEDINELLKHLAQSLNQPFVARILE